MSDITVHIDETLAEDRRASLSDKIRTHAGVQNVRQTPSAPHLLVVDYDPGQVHSDQILAWVRDEGVHAELLGL